MFVPKRIIIEKEASKYSLTNNIIDFFKDRKIEIIRLNSNRVKEKIPGKDIENQYRESKKTLVLGVKKGLKFQTCKPSADYQLPLVLGCMGQCEYCYLNTRFGEKPFTKLYVNVDDILLKADDYIKEGFPNKILFEGSATSDPIAVEPYGKSLEKAIIFFGKKKNTGFRFVTKYNDVDSLLDLEHNGNTEARFTLNTDYVINNFEHYTPLLQKRIEGAKKMIESGYKVGFLIAPVFIYDDWKNDYQNLLELLREEFLNYKDEITFEIITHRYTTTAKNVILEVFKNSKLPMNDEERKYKYGQFGYGKYVYDKQNMQEVKDFFNDNIGRLFNRKNILYIV